MKYLLTLTISLPLSAQFATFDGANYGLNAEKLRQGIADAQRAIQYYEMARNVAAFVRNPAGFLAATTAMASMAVSDSARAGWTSRQLADQLQSKLAMGQILINESAQMGMLSSGNAANVQSTAVMMQATSEKLARLRAQMQYEQRYEHYKEENKYEDQGKVISAWRLK